MDTKFKLNLYKGMLRIRAFEMRTSDLFAKGEIFGFYHLYVGQEAIATGVCAALNEDDYITSTHRGHGHVLAKGARMDRMMSEMYAKETGYCKAKGGSLHIAVPELGILGANGIVGAGIPIATGAALSSKLQKNGKVAVSFFGDAGSNQGTFHEAVNIASAFDLPAIFVCENNLYGVGTRQSTVRRVENIADRAVGYAIPGVTVDGNDVEAVYNATIEAVQRARGGGGPTLLECKTFRMHMHFEGEPDNYRNSDEVSEWKDKDPIARYEAKLLSEGIYLEEIEGVKREVQQEIDDAVEFSRNSPTPKPESALTDVYDMN